MTMVDDLRPPDLDEPRAVITARARPDRVYRGITAAAGSTTLVIMGLIALFLLLRAAPALRQAGWSFLTVHEWAPEASPPRFGVAAVVYGTVVISAIALLFAVPLALGTALFINEVAPRRLRRGLTSLVDLLAAVPSLIYGIWGFGFLQPRLYGVGRWLSDHVGFVPIFETRTQAFGSSMFVCGLVVALMVLPITTSVVREVFSQAPPGEREGALALGATRWGMIRMVVLPFGRGGIVGGTMLGLGRALGETIAITLIISPSTVISPRILDPGGQSIASLIALRFSEANDFGLRALMAAGLALFVLTLIVNLGATAIVSRSRSGKGVEI